MTVAGPTGQARSAQRIKFADPERTRGLDARRAGIVIRTRIYDIKTGAYLRDE